MGDDFWKPTAECFQQIFNKPKMTEKLLTRPPFRYIHDIYTATMAATGFGEGLYSDEELDAKAIKDKEGKINFLDKLITLVQLAAGEEIPVKSTKIVAGHEAEQTNIFLQYLFKVSTSGIDSAPIVAQIVGGDDEGDQQQEDDQEAQAQAEAEEQARREAEDEQRKREKRAAKKKAMEEQKLLEQQQQQEAEAEAERQRQIQEEEAERAREQARAQREARRKKKEQVDEPPMTNPNIIEDGQEEEDIIGDEQEEDIIGDGLDEANPESKFARKAMEQLRQQDDDDQADRIEDDASGGIKMGKIGRRNRKKGGVERSEPQKKILQAEAPKRSYGGYSEDDIEFMRKAIQSLCQSTNPLGKSIDFVTEDIDSMTKEYEHWKLDYAESQSKLEEQQRITEQTIQPLQDVELAQLEEKIREEKMKIQNIRSQIIRNDNTIQNLLQSVISSG